MTPRRSRDLGTTVAAVVALAPGFAIPFVVSSVLSGSRSDLLLLATSVALTLVNVVGNAVEANTVSEVGRSLGRGGTGPASAALQRYQRRVMTFVLVVTLGVGPLLIGCYALRGTDVAEFVPVAGVLLLVPLIGGLASVRSGEVIAHGRVGLAICLQGARSVLPLALVVAWPTVPLLALAVAFALGELARLLALTAWCRRTRAEAAQPGATTDGPAAGGHPAASDEELPTNGLVWQSASALTSQAGPVTDRLFLVAAPVGSVSSYEMADKVFFAAVQVMNLGFLVRRVAGWARLPTMTPGDGLARLRRDLSVLLGAAAVVGLAAAGLALVARRVPLVPPGWHQGLLWSAILLSALPVSMAVMAGGRLLIIARRQDLLLRFSVWTAIGNAVLDAALFFPLGPVGIPIATVLSRLLSAVAYAVVVRRLLPRILGPAYQYEDSSTAARVP